MAHLLHRFCPSTSLTWLILLKVRKSHLAVMLDKMLLLLALFSLCFHTRSLTGCRNPVFPFPFLTSMFSFQSQLAALLRSSDMSQVGDLESWIFFFSWVFGSRREERQRSHTGTFKLPELSPEVLQRQSNPHWTTAAWGHHSDCHG